MRVMIRRSAFLLVLLCACVPCYSAELFDLAQPGLGLPWDAPPSAVSARFPGLMPDPLPGSYQYLGPVQIGHFGFEKRLVFMKFERGGGLSELRCIIPSDDIVAIVRLIRSKLGEGRTASYQDARVFQRLHEWAQGDFSIELQYTALTADELSAPYPKFDAHILIKRELARPSLLDFALDLPRRAEAVKQQMLELMKKEQQEAAAKKQKHSEPSSR